MYAGLQHWWFCPSCSLSLLSPLQTRLVGVRSTLWRDSRTTGKYTGHSVDRLLLPVDYYSQYILCEPPALHIALCDQGLPRYFSGTGIGGRGGTGRDNETAVKMKPSPRPVRSHS